MQQEEILCELLQLPVVRAAAAAWTIAGKLLLSKHGGIVAFTRRCYTFPGGNYPAPVCMC